MNIKYPQLLSIAFSLVLSAFYQESYSQTYQWANIGTSEGYDYGNGITTDDSGNVYVSGQFEYDCDFGSKTLSTAGQHDIFIAKYNTSGTLMWAKRAGGTDGEAGHGIGIDAARNLYTTGEFEKTCKWTSSDSLTVGNIGINNIYLSKYDYNGNFQWVRQGYSTGDSRGRGLVADSAGNSYFTGSFANTVSFGGINLSYTGYTDVFLVKYDSNGNAIWARKGGGTKDDKGKGVALDNLGNVYVCATFTQNVSVSGNSFSAVGRYDSYIAKYDTSGSFQWYVKAGGTDTTKMSGIASDIDGNVYVTGYFKDTTTFGTTTLYSLGSYEFFIAKYDANGNFVWAKRGGGPNEDFGQGICYDRKTNQIYIAGQFDFQANFDGLAVSSVGNRDVFVSCWDTSGSIQWIRTGGGVRRDAGFAIANDTLGNIYSTGFVDEGATFGTHTILGDSMANVFVTKLAPPIASQPTIAASNISSSVINCDDINLSWTSGNGAFRMVIAKAGSAVSVLPVDGTSYSASATFGNGSYLGSGNYVVYSGSGNSCTVTGLTAGTRYYFAIIEFNGSGILSNYNTTSYPVTNVLATSFTVSANASPAAICPGASTTLTATGGVTYSWSPSTGLSSTTGSSVTATLNSSVTYTITATDGSGCISTTTLPVTVNPLPTVTQSSFADECITTTSVTLTGGSPAGGAYSGAFVNAGVFNPSAAGVGQHNITYSYTDGNGCSNSAIESINVRALPVVSVNTQNAICLNANSVALTGGSPSGGVYSGTGVSNGNFDPSVAGLGSHIITYSYTDGFGCSNSDTATILVNALPTVTLSAFNAVCVNTSSFLLTGGSPAGGVYSGTGVSSGSFYPNVSGSGTHTITYTYSDVNGCSANATGSITVNALPVVTLGSFNAVCQNSAPFALTGGNPAGGTYSGSGVSNGIFTPSSAGSNNILYNYTDANGCSNFATSSILVNTLPNVSVTPFSPVCQNSASFPLTGGNPAGGTWTGTNVSAGIFDPVTSGGNMVIYNYTDANGCTNFATTTITVNAPPAVTVSPINGVCVGSAAFALTGGLPAGGTWSGANVNAGNFDPVTTGVNTVVYSYTDGNGCSGSASATINVYALPVVTLAPDTTICMYHNIAIDAGAGFSSYLWSNGASTQVIVVDSTGTGTGTASYTVTVSNSFSCTASDGINITFDICAGIALSDKQQPLGIVYPNPFNGEFSVITDAAEQDIQLALFDVLGNVILKKTLTSGSEIIRPDVTAGIYFLQLSKGRIITSVKLVKTQ